MENIAIDKNYVLDKIDSASSESLLNGLIEDRKVLEENYAKEKTDKNYQKINKMNKRIKQVQKAMSLELELKEEASIYNLSIKDYSRMTQKEEYINENDLKIARKIESKAYDLTGQIYKKALEVEPKITSDLKKLEKDDLFLIGIDKNIKSIESTSRKIIKKYLDSAKNGKKINPKNISKFVHDSNRYTFISAGKTYMNNINYVLDTLIQNGYTLIKFKNKWGNRYYQGINVNLKTPYDTIMEIQFHTLDSYLVKEKLNHPYYEITRNKFIPKFNRDIAGEIQEIYQKLVKVPKGIKKYNYRNKRK